MYRVKQKDLMELIKGRRSVRCWSARDVELEKLEHIIVAGMYAPSACNSQKTRILTVKGKEVIAIICENSAPWFRKVHPPVVIAVLFDLEKPHPLGFNLALSHPWSRFIWQDTACAMMSMMLIAESLGLRTCWQSVEPKELSRKEFAIRQVLNITDRYLLACLLFVGYSDDEPDIKTHRHYGVAIKRSRAEFEINFE